MNTVTRQIVAVLAMFALSAAQANSASKMATGKTAELALESVATEEYAAYRDAWKILEAVAPLALDVAKSTDAALVAAAEALEAAAPHQVAAERAALAASRAARDAWEIAAAEEITKAAAASDVYLGLAPDDESYRAASAAYVDAIKARDEAAPREYAVMIAASEAAEAADKALMAAAPDEYAAKQAAFDAVLSADTALTTSALDELEAFQAARRALVAAAPEEYNSWLPKINWKQPTR